MLKQSQWQHIFCPKPTPISTLSDFNGVKLWVKRDDLNHAIIQGNKLRKLKYNFKYLIEKNYTGIATFGGAWSNHLLATALAAKLMGVKSLGFIRGDELENKTDKWSNTLSHVKELGMELVFLNRQEYRKKQQAQEVQKRLNNKTYLIPEGGSNNLAIKGVAEIITELKCQIKPPTHIITACGTAGTMAGLIDGIAEVGWQTKIIGIPILKSANFLNDEVIKLSQNHNKVNWQLFLDYHAGGYAKINIETSDFAKKFTKDNNIPLDKIYTAKSFFAAYDLINKAEIPANSQLLILHTGGLQGGIITQD